MDLKSILLLVAGGSLFLFLLLIILLKIMQRRAARLGQQDVRQSGLLIPSRRSAQVWLINYYQKAYVYMSRTPIVQNYVLKIRSRLGSIHSYDEFTMRKETMKIVSATLGIYLSALIALALLSNSLTFLAMVLLAILVIHNMLVDAFINRVEDRLLKQIALLMTDVRHHYHQHGMVEEAIYEAAQVSKYEAALHAEKIYEVLTSLRPEEELEAYYDVAPNRFLKAFAGISYLTKEYGDKLLQHGSMYLNSLSRLANEINLEILRRERLNYLFKGLTAIAIAPVLFTYPIEEWARTNFPTMDLFYSSKWGFIAKLVVFVVILIAYVLLRKMMENDEGKYAAKANRNKWEKKAYEQRWMKAIVDRLTPGTHTKEYFRYTTLLKDTNSPLTIEWLYVQRLVFGVLCLVLSVSMFFYVHHFSKQSVLHDPTRNAWMFGESSPEELAKQQAITDADRAILLQVIEQEGDVKDNIQAALDASEANDLKTQNAQLADIARIAEKVAVYENEYFKWWELAICIVIGLVGYTSPLWLIWFQLRMRQMDMQNEVDQFHAIIAMLAEYERVSVENIIEWMERFAVVFKRPLQNCLMNYEMGADQAMEQVKEDAPFQPLVRTMERLQVAVDRIPIRQAFDDLEAERNYYQEVRKQHYERVINEKSAWGKMIGFVPMYALVFLYLVIPLIYMSMQQMTTYFDQIKSI